jgi:hypothetical protein
MLQKTALIVASLAASLTLAFALAAAGFAPGATNVSADPAAAVSVDAAATAAAPLVQIDKVYVPAPEPQKTITVNQVVQTAGGESEGAEGND